MTPGSRRAVGWLLLVAASGCGGALQETRREGTVTYEEGKAALDRGAYAEAILGLKAYVERFPGTDKTDDALYDLGIAYMETKDYALASGQFDRLIRDFPLSPNHSDALFELARSDDLQSNPAYLDQSETQRAIARYQEFLNLYPDHDRAGEARARIAALRDRLAEKDFRNGRLYYKLKYNDAAIIYFRDIIAEYPESRWAGEATLLLAETLLRQGKPAEAAAALKPLAERGPADDLGQRAAALMRTLPGEERTP